MPFTYYTSKEIDMKVNPRPTGDLQGDDSPIPTHNENARGGDSYGADLGPDATNRIGSIAGSTKSDPEKMPPG